MRFWTGPLPFVAILCVAGLLFLRRRDDPTRQGFGKILLVVAGLLVMWGVLWPSVRYVLFSPVRRVVGASADEVIALELRPHSWGAGEPHLVEAIVRTEEREHIDAIVAALRESRPWVDNHPRSVWACELVIHYGEKAYYCDVYSTTNSGVCFAIVSGHGRVGTLFTSYGTYRSDSLGPLLEQLASRSQEGEPPSPSIGAEGALETH